MNRSRAILFGMLLLALACPAWAQAQTADGNPQVTIRTSKGEIRLELFADGRARYMGIGGCSGMHSFEACMALPAFAQTQPSACPDAA